MLTPSLRRTGLSGALIAIALICAPVAAAPWEREAHLLWQKVELQISRLRKELGFHSLSEPVHSALIDTPRHHFVPESQRKNAYRNRPLPIGYGQTISQPLIVAAMTEMLAVKPGDKVLELGTGSGYQAAILDALGARVFSVEIISELSERARETLDALGHGQVETRIGDGYNGWPDQAPFDAIIVTAANDHIPPPLLRQLKPGGRLLIPIGNRYLTQKLVLVTRSTEGKIRTREIMPVTFVPLTGKR